MMPLRLSVSLPPVTRVLLMALSRMQQKASGKTQRGGVRSVRRESGGGSDTRDE